MSTTPPMIEIPDSPAVASAGALSLSRPGLVQASSSARPPIINFFQATRDLSPCHGTLTAVRCERKWIPAGLSLAEVLAEVRRHAAGFRTVYPERQINNIYFDTPGLDYYRDHISGASERVKVRLRWYGDFNRPGPRPVLELKFKRGSASWKESFALPGMPFQGWPSFFRERDWWAPVAIPECLRLRLRPLRPAVANHYRRKYFCAAGSDIRLTVDFQFGFLGVEGWNACLPHLPYHGPPVVLEIKFVEAQADRAAEIMQEFPFRLGRCSKYVLGIQHLDGSD